MALSRLADSLLHDWMWMRPALGLACILIGYVILFVVSGKFPESQDIPSWFALSIGVFGLTQGLLRWFAVPSPTVLPGQSVRVPNDCAILHLKVFNYNVYRWLRPLVLRSAPEGCQAWIRYRCGEQVVLDWVLGRWNENWEPVDYNTGKPDLKTMLKNRRLEKLYPTERSGLLSTPYEIAFAVKQQNNEDFWHFNDESYQFDLWKNPDWVLPKAQFKLDVQITGHGLIRPTIACFGLENSGTDHGDLHFID